MKKILISFFILLSLLAINPNKALAQESDGSFEAKITSIIDEKVLPDGSKQQNIKLRGLEGEFKDRDVVFYGISDITVTKSTTYKEGEKVIVGYSKNSDGGEFFYILDYVRKTNIYILFFIFLIVIIAIGRWKGVKALVSLGISIFIIMAFIVPQIIAGANPVFISIIGSFLILLAIVYLTEGFGRKSHIAAISILACLVITVVLSVIFNSLTKLTGMSSEETLFLVNIGQTKINFQGLLLAGMIIGALGVLDDIVIGQVEAVNQIKKANPGLSKSATFKAAHEIGNAHFGAIINTLFLAYAGVSMPMLLLFNLGREPFVSFGDVINNEIIATEIVRTLVGSIGLAFAIPITTFLAVNFYKPEPEPQKSEPKFHKYVKK